MFTLRRDLEDWQLVWSTCSVVNMWPLYSLCSHVHSLFMCSGMRTKQEIEILPCADIVTYFLLLFSVYDWLSTRYDVFNYLYSFRLVNTFVTTWFFLEMFPLHTVFQHIVLSSKKFKLWTSSLLLRNGAWNINV
jgi:hypothetical protein